MMSLHVKPNQTLKEWPNKTKQGPQTLLPSTLDQARLLWAWASGDAEPSLAWAWAQAWDIIN